MNLNDFYMMYGNIEYGLRIRNDQVIIMYFDPEKTTTRILGHHRTPTLLSSMKMNFDENYQLTITSDVTNGEIISILTTPLLGESNKIAKGLIYGNSKFVLDEILNFDLLTKSTGVSKEYFESIFDLETVYTDISKFVLRMMGSNVVLARRLN